MIQEIMKDVMFLQTPGQLAGKDDLSIAQDLLDTLMAHREHCVGMAANMIGVSKRIIAFWDDDKKTYEVMLNPEIIKTAGKRYSVEEGCLSLSGERETKRYEKIKVRYQNMDMQVRIRSYEGFSAQIIQHEIDHCNGILI